MKYLILILALFLCSCYGKKKFVKYADKHPVDLAEQCSAKFPCIDSITPPVIVYKPAINKDYQPKIDSLSQALKNAKNDIDNLIVPSNCEPIRDAYKKQINLLTNQVQNLKYNYKKCTPDTVFVSQVIYRVDSAKLAVLRAQLTETKEALKKAKPYKSKYIQLVWSSIVMGLVILALGYFLLRK